ncbi:hypothetical protein AN639_02975 [Candidatus Epulonipiscium fishelsonii]|uniref:Uncharacterized protein n=1 Tax=Candidatus Epulonipiscium fishelsonii TaxID=77094 RepID=A0ACC8XCW8_9FIRM|nr:hypothetical protein AN396_05665 [Epulopiscium sp. SCG-B11WGA-EpuloA1]ONI41792.1 hypothetical protein AN639_02975 [Epulopiscium sp. SCG-B05WGA-EpuloA1]
MKKALSFLFLSTISLSIFNTATVYGLEGTSDLLNDASKFVKLDENPWYFKEYRTYNQMFQYLPYQKCEIVTEDLNLALLPNSELFTTWPVVDMPADGNDGGLLPLTKEDGSSLFKNWSEAWVATEFTLPENFTDDENVTLLLGIIDDADVVYINGHLVASSGFMDKNGTPMLNNSESGGFKYNYKDSTDATQILFEKSYWEVNREYSIPSDILNEGGTNEIAIRLFNNNGNGGFYSGYEYAICGNELAVREVKGLPTNNINDPVFEDVINKQKDAIETSNSSAFAKTVMDNYNANYTDKDAYVSDFKSKSSTDLTVADTNPSYWLDDNGTYSYEATRKITNSLGEIIFEGHITQYFTENNGTLKEQGNMSHCYTATYNSNLFKDASGNPLEMKYSVYLPPSYYENTDKHYPVVYLLHGINSSSESFLKVDKIEDFLDDQMTNNNLMEMIVVMPDSGKTSGYDDTEYDPANHNSTGPWASHITDEIRHEIENKYRTINQAEFRGITGISMGGGGAMKLGIANPDLYSSIASHMGALNDTTLNMLKSLTPEQMAKYDFYVDCGLQDIMVDYQNTVKTHEYLRNIGKEHGYSLRNGAHNSAFYMSSMADSFKMHSDHFRQSSLKRIVIILASL